MAVVDAAIHTFASAGYHGTPVTDVAAAAGISPAYVFRLFPTKRELFIAALHECFDRILAALAAGLASAPPSASEAERLSAMAHQYAGLIADRDLMMLQVHALAATTDQQIRSALRTEQARLVAFVSDRSGASQPAVQEFFARGLLCHLMLALDLTSVRAPWARQLTDGMYDPPATTPARRRRT